MPINPAAVRPPPPRLYVDGTAKSPFDDDEGEIDTSGETSASSRLGGTRVAFFVVVGAIVAALLLEIAPRLLSG